MGFDPREKSGGRTASGGVAEEGDKPRVILALPWLEKPKGQWQTFGVELGS